MTDSSAKIHSKPKNKKSTRYITILLVLMITSSIIGAIFGFSFGKKSLEGVNLVPLGSKKTNLIVNPQSPRLQSAPIIP